MCNNLLGLKTLNTLTMFTSYLRHYMGSSKLLEYERLRVFLLAKSFKIRRVDSKLFTKLIDESSLFAKYMLIYNLWFY